MGRLRLAIIGCGSITKHRHAPEVKQNPDAELVAVCDRNIEHAKAVAEKFGVENVYDDYVKMLEQKSLMQ